MDDRAATRACREGNVDAFRHFVDRYQVRALAHARLLTRNEADAADTTQEAFVDAFRNLHAFDPGRPVYETRPNGESMWTKAIFFPSRPSVCFR